MRQGSRIVAASEPERPGWAMKRPPPTTERAAVLRRLVQLRKAAGVNQTTLADRLGITQSEVSKFERGERALGMLRLRAWLRALGVELQSFAEALDQELERQEVVAG